LATLFYIHCDTTPTVLDDPCKEKFEEMFENSTTNFSLLDQSSLSGENPLGDVLHQCISSELSTKNIANCQFMDILMKCNSVVAKMTKEYEALINSYILNVAKKT
jgi:hypothetical protein